MATVSLCMIVKNEEETLPRCLGSVRDLVDEIVIVDTGSTDGTVEAARRFTDRVFFFPWRDDFSAARNFSFDQAAGDFCMWLDADDVLEEKDRVRFREMRAALTTETDVVMMPYHTSFSADGKPAFTYWRERLIRRDAGFRWKGAVHEAIAPRGRILYCGAAVSHRKTRPGDADRNLRIYEAQRARGEAFSPRDTFYYARELMFHGRDEEAAAAFRSFLDGGGGWVENELQACRDLAACEMRLDRTEASFKALTRALRYGPPRPELCCDLGRFFFDRKDFVTAAYWYEQALSARPSGVTGGFTEPDASGFLPCIQLCVCYYALGDAARSKEMNDRAAAFRPEHPAVRYNARFFGEDAPL